MQPQDVGLGWLVAFAGMVGATVGAGSTILTWIVKAARMKPTIRAEIVAAEQRVEKKIDDKIESEMGHIRETLIGIREKINEVERESLPREEFREFLQQHREDAKIDREERRQDFAELKRNIAEMMGRKTH